MGAIDFDLCGWAYYLFDLYVVRTALRTYYSARLTPLWKASLEGYKRERSLPEDYQRYLTTFDTMHNVAVVNRQLVLLSSEGTSSQRKPWLSPNVRNILATREEGNTVRNGPPGGSNTLHLSPGMPRRFSDVSEPFAKMLPALF